MSSNRLDMAALLARVTLGLVLVAHGLTKFLVFTLPGTAQFFASVGFPGWTAYVVAPLEVLTGLLMLAGIRSSLAALAALPVLLGAVLVHSGNGWSFTSANGGWEYPAVLVALAAAVALLGDGAYSVRRAPRRRAQLASARTSTAA